MKLPDSPAAALGELSDLVDALGARSRDRLGGPLPVIAALVLLAGLGLLHATAPAVAVNDMILDVFVPLDGAWRWVHGQIPHRDFHTPVGIAWYAAYGEAMKAFGPSPLVLLWMPVLAAIPVVAFSLLATRARMAPLLQGAVALYLGLVAFSPRHLDRESIAHLASYNRVGWALCTAVLLMVTLPPSRRSKAVAVLEAVAAAAALALVAYLKITYFALGGFGVLLAVALVPRNRGVAFAAGVGAWALLGAGALLSDIPMAYIADIRAAGASWDPAWAAWNAERVPGTTKLVAGGVANGVALLGAVLGLLAASRAAGETDRGEVDKAGLVVLALVAAVLGTTMLSHDHYAPAAIAPLLVTLAVTERRRAAGLLTAAALWVVASMAWSDVSAIATHRIAAGSQTGTVPASTHDSPLAALRWGGSPAVEPKLRLVRDGEVSAEVFGKLVPTPGLGGTDLQLLLDSGLDAAAIAPGARILSVSFSQPFAWATGAPPPRDTLSWYDPGRSFGGDNPLAPEVILADVDVVLVPRVMELPVKWAMWEQLGPAVEAGYTRHDTPLWTAWVRDERR